MRRVMVVAAVFFVVVVLWLLLTNPPSSISGKILSFTLTPLMSSNSTPRLCSVVIANTSGSPVMFAGGFNKAWLQIDYLTTNGWRSDQIRTPGGGNGVLQPNQQLTNTVEVPEAASKLRVGLPVTSLTWRGRLAWRVAGNRSVEVLMPLAGFLLRQDEKARSRTDWSGDYVPRNVGGAGQFELLRAKLTSTSCQIRTQGQLPSRPAGMVRSG